MNNEGIEIIEDPEYHIDNPGSGNWPTVPKESDANSTGVFSMSKSELVTRRL